ncbi:MAG: hypothetical protein HRU26_07200 [Psychroserpens sp.]|nr:hypothetical protein [Psychroserpens sp.]
MSDENQMTLEQGLEQFYKCYPEDLSHNDEGLPEDVKAFFRAHDIAHVIFGCDISLFGEGAVKIWTTFGTSLGFWKHLSEYKQANAFELSKKFPFLRSLKDLLKLIIYFPSFILRAKRMLKLWPWTDYEKYLDKPISEIRREFNIKVLK